MTNVEALCADWLDAKHAENAARDKRIAIEAHLSEALDVPDEGSKTHQLTEYKVTLTQPVSRKLDEAEWVLVKDRVAPSLRPVKVKIEADAAGCKYLLKNESDAWAKIASAFETKPGKVGVKVEKK